jgi:hypothetical protein
MIPSHPTSDPRTAPYVPQLPAPLREAPRLAPSYHPPSLPASTPRANAPFATAKSRSVPKSPEAIGCGRRFGCCRRITSMVFGLCLVRSRWNSGRREKANEDIGEIDLLEARGNGPEYPAQGVNYIRSSLNYGPMASLYTQLYGWQSKKRSGFDQGTPFPFPIPHLILTTS